MFLKLKTLHFLDSIHIAIFVYASSKKKCITCKVLHSTAHGISHSISATYVMSAFLLPLISSSESIVSISNLAHLHSGECRL